MATGLEYPITIKLHRHELEIEGVKIAYFAIPQIIHALINPNPRKWFRFERVNENEIYIHVRMTEDEPYGTPIGSTTGHGEENAGRQGQEDAHPRDASETVGGWQGISNT